MAKTARFLKITVIIAVAALFAACQSTETIKSSEPTMASGIDFIMDTVVEQRWYGDDSRLFSDEIAKHLKYLEGEISRFTTTGEIFNINQNAGVKAVEVSAQTYDIIKTALSYCESSQGVFDISISPLTKIWNITGENPKVPAEQDILSAKSLVNYKNIILNDDKKTVLLAEKGMSLDLGGVAKGMAATMVSSIAKQHNVTGFLSIGGNMMVLGKKPNGEDFRFGVRDPKGGQDDYVATVTLEGMTMATTGTYERFFEEDGVRYHHVLDPFTGYPAQSDLSSVTVISEDGGLGDYLSTFIFMGGVEKLAPHLEAQEYFVIAIDNNDNIYTSPGYRSKITPNKNNSRYNFIAY